LYRFGVMCFDDDSACSNNCRPKQGMILHIVSTRKWFHSPCHRDLSLSPSLFNSFFTSYVHANITRHQQNFLVPLMLISYYKQRMSIAFQCAQAIMILQWGVVLNHNSSSFPHIVASAPPSLVDLWHRMPF